MAVEKAAGVLSHPNRKEDRKRSLLRAPFDEKAEAFAMEGRRWFLLHRLDAPTSGVVLLAEDPELATAVRRLFADHVVKKHYIALVKGFQRASRATWRDHLAVRRRGGRLRTIVRRSPPNAVTDVRVRLHRRGTPAMTLLDLFPRTGRTHQLRVQCASRHLPILGDATYGDFAFNRGVKQRTGHHRLFLHSHRIEVPLVWKGTEIAFSAESPLPTEFVSA
jgi:23S rRNA-/tRNA-specific pseudouridylate synthase